MKNPAISEDQQMRFFRAVQTHFCEEETLELCTRMIKGSRAPNYTLIEKMKSMSQREMIIAMNNFIMKGHGYGV